MLSCSPVVDYKQGVEILANKIRSYEENAPYIATIRGIHGIGKSRFGRDILQTSGFSQRGLLIKPHDLRREQYRRDTFKYILLEIDQIDNAYQDLIDLDVKKFCGKKCDYQVLVVHQLAPLLDSSLSLERILKFFDLVVENKEHPSYR